MKISQLVVRIIGIVLGVAMMIVGIAGLGGGFVYSSTSSGTNAPYSATYGADFYTDTAEYMEIIGNNTDAIAENTARIIWGLESLSCQIGAICLVAGLLIVVFFVDKLIEGLPLKREPRVQMPSYIPQQNANPSLLYQQAVVPQPHVQPAYQPTSAQQIPGQPSQQPFSRQEFTEPVYQRPATPQVQSQMPPRQQTTPPVSMHQNPAPKPTASNQGSNDLPPL